MKSILKKIGCILVGSTVLSASITAAYALEKYGNINDFIDDDLIKNGNPDVYIVVGENAAALDVTSANKISAKIGTLTYSETIIEDESTVEYQIIGESESIDLLDGTDKLDSAGTEKSWILVTSADDDYADHFDDEEGNSFSYSGFSEADQTKSLGHFGYLLKVGDIDPENHFESDDDAAEIVFVRITDSNKNADSQIFDIGKDMVYASIVYPNQVSAFKLTKDLKEGYEIPFLGKKYRVVQIDEDDGIIYLGTASYDGTLEQGNYISSGEYQVVIGEILESGDEYSVEISILRNGNIIKEHTEILRSDKSFSVIAGDLGVTVHDVWTNAAADTGYADITICRSLTELELGEEYMNNWEVRAVTNTGGTIDFLKTYEDNTVGIALVYVGSDIEGITDGDRIKIADYVNLVFDDEDDLDKMVAEFKAERTVTTGSTGGTVISKSGEVPEILMDSEIELDKTDKNLILIGGPVANKLTKELQNEGKIDINNESPATASLIEGAANGNNVLVITGGDRYSTESAVLSLINLI
ncbi:S-layer protein (TIGR01564 family) [Methanococcus maripaludis]|uniref:S-layer protein (TIGR01564 family) n=1 Tax=Methanococcus maripaludis TaxID=39152 RepID=A0A7J9NKI1_METMI|nr:S-layer protein [Methanococcus maripaludis]MBA2841090.1 S-layer protein (TIGR01564 family) [Methanococcus maripaludis]